MRQLSELALKSARANNDAATEVDALCWLSRVALREGDVERVKALAEDAFAVARATGEAQLQRMPLHMQAVAARMQRDYALSRHLYQTSIELNRTLRNERMVAGELRNLAYVELHDGRLEQAKQLFKQARVEARRLVYDTLLPYLVADAAVVASEEGDQERAARLLGSARAAFLAAQQMPDPDDSAEQDWLSAKLIRLLGEERFRAAQEEGASHTLEEALGDR